MKKFLLISLLMLCGCENFSKRVEVNEQGKVNINGKDCELIRVDTGGLNVLFIDCGPGSSTTVLPGKTPVTVGQYIPPSAPSCSASCPTTPPMSEEDRKKFDELWKKFYGK